MTGSQGDSDEVGAEIGTEMDDAEINLLSSPIERTLVNRAFVIGGPLALLVTILLSLWVSWSHVRFYTTVQTDRSWTPGQTRAVRVQVHSDRGYDPGERDVEVQLEQDGTRTPLGTLGSVGVGVAQGTVALPDSAHPGPAKLWLTMPVEPDPIVEAVEIEVAEGPAPREATPMISSSMAQYSNDTDPQPEAVKIDLRAFGRVQTGFDNRFYLRVTDAVGTPWSGPVQVVLLQGELGPHVARPEDPKTLIRGTTSRMGLLSWDGLLVSETLRVQVRVMSKSAPDQQVAARKIMLISFAGVVSLRADRYLADRGRELQLSIAGLSGKRSIFLDVHDADGAWIETLPPALGRDPPRAWTVPESLGDGLAQLEAYDQPNAPGESTAVVRLQVGRESSDAISLRPLIDAHERALKLPRIDDSFDPARERTWLSEVGGLDLSADEVGELREYLVGTLPVAVYGPPLALSTRERDDEALAAFKRRWTIALRWVLLGGGGLFLATMTVMMVRAHAEAAEKTLAELKQTGALEEDRMQEAITHARRTGMVRGLGLVAVMAAGLVLAVLMLEAMVWEF